MDVKRDILREIANLKARMRETQRQMMQQGRIMHDPRAQRCTQDKRDASM